MVKISGLEYVGPVPADPTDVVTGNKLGAILGALTPNRTTVSSQVIAQIDTTYASKALVDETHSAFVAPSYYQAQDKLNLAPAQVGAPGGVAGLDASGKVPLPQMPNLGEGYIRGPWGPTTLLTGATDDTPLYIADWQIGEAYLSFRPMLFVLCFIAGTMGSQPVIEIWCNDTDTQPTYTQAQAGTLVCRGVGRYGYSDYHTVACWPTPDTPGEPPSLLPPSYKVWLSAWLYDLSGQGVTIEQGGVTTGAAFLMRGSQ